MAYDEVVASRIRVALAAEPDVDEQRMFGGLAFLVNGHMAVAASSTSGAPVRVDPERAGQLIDTTAAVPMVMRGKPMRGWLSVPPSELVTQRDVTRWVRIGVDHARSLPPKTPSHT